MSEVSMCVSCFHCMDDHTLDTLQRMLPDWQRLRQLEHQVAVERDINNQLARSYATTDRLVGELRDLLQEASVCVSECGFHKVDYHEDLEARIRMAGVPS